MADMPTPEQAAQPTADAELAAMQAERDDEREFVQRWWDWTDDTEEYSEFIEQWKNDIQTLEGGKPEDLKDETAVTVQHVYRNGLQATAMVAPDEHSMRWRPRKQVAAKHDATAPVGPTDDRALFAETLELVIRGHMDEADGDEVLDAFIQDCNHFEMGVLKCTYQRDYADQPVGARRLPDAQDNLARIQALTNALMSGDVEDTGATREELRSLTEGLLGEPELPVFTGLVLENLNLNQVRVSPEVNDPTNVYMAKWISHDVLMQRQDAKAKYDLTDEDLAVATVHTMAGTVAGDFKEHETERQEGERKIRPDDLLLVREIWWKDGNEVIWLIEGMERPANRWRPPSPTKQWYPFFIFVSNRFPGRLRGMSDTEMQAKIQRQRNLKRTFEEDARRASQPRFVYDSAQVDETIARRIADAAPWEAIPIDLGGKDIRQAILPLVGNHSYDPREYDDSKEEREQTKMANLPSQATGVTENADFSSEVQLAAHAMTAGIKFRQKKFSRLLRRFYIYVAELLLQETTPDEARMYAGPYALWPDAAPEREWLFKFLDCDVEPAMNAEFQNDKQLKNAMKLLEILLTTAPTANIEPLMRRIARLMGEDKDLNEIYRPDLGRSMVGVMTGLQNQDPGTVDPELLDQFMSMLAPLVSRYLMQRQLEDAQAQAEDQQAQAG